MIFGPPQQMVIPQARVHLLRRRSVQVGVPVMIIGLVLSPILVLLPYQLVPYGDPLRFAIALFAGMLGLSTIGAGGMALLARMAVRTGHLGLPDMRAARGALMFCWLLGALSAVMALGTLALVVSTPPQEHRATVQFDGPDWLYVLLLAAAAVLCGLAFFAIRRVLWRPRDGWGPLPPLR